MATERRDLSGGSISYLDYIEGVNGPKRANSNFDYQEKEAKAVVEELDEWLATIDSRLTEAGIRPVQETQATKIDRDKGAALVERATRVDAPKKIRRVNHRYDQIVKWWMDDVVGPIGPLLDRKGNVVRDDNGVPIPFDTDLYVEWKLFENNREHPFDVDRDVYIRYDMENSFQLDDQYPFTKFEYDPTWNYETANAAWKDYLRSKFDTKAAVKAAGYPLEIPSYDGRPDDLIFVGFPNSFANQQYKKDLREFQYSERVYRKEHRALIGQIKEGDVDEIGSDRWLKRYNKSELHKILRWNDQAPPAIQEMRVDEVRDRIRIMVESIPQDKLILTEEQYKKKPFIDAGYMDKDDLNVRLREDGLPVGYKGFHKLKTNEELQKIPITPEIATEIPEDFPDPRQSLSDNELETLSDAELMLWMRLRDRLRKSEYARQLERIKREMKVMEDPAARELMRQDALAYQKEIVRVPRNIAPEALRQVMRGGRENMGTPEGREMMLERRREMNAARRARRNRSLSDIVHERLESQVDNMVRPYEEMLALRPLETWSPMTKAELYTQQIDTVEKILDRKDGRPVQQNRMVDKDGEDVLPTVENIAPAAATRVIMGFFSQVQLDPNGELLFQHNDEDTVTPETIEADVIRPAIEASQEPHNDGLWDGYDSEEDDDDELF